MAYAQLTWCESLSDIEVTLGAKAAKIYAMGLRQAVRRSRLADANNRRDWRIRADFASVLICRSNKQIRTRLLAWMTTSQATCMRFIRAPVICA